MAGVPSCWVGLVVLVTALAAPVIATIPPECNTTGTPNVDLRLERCAFHDINAEVRMFNMGIVHVSPGCFAGNQIGRLYMPGNPITEFVGGTFDGLTLQHELDLASMPALVTVKAGFTTGLRGAAAYVYMDSCPHLATVEPGAFSCLSAAGLDLMFGNISALAPGALGNLRVGGLYLDANPLTGLVATGAFRNTTVTGSLTLAQTKMTSIGGAQFDGVTVGTLLMDYNKRLTGLLDGAFTGVTAGGIVVKKNPVLAVVEAGAFKDATVGTLSISTCPITSLAIRGARFSGNVDISAPQLQAVSQPFEDTHIRGDLTLTLPVLTSIDSLGAAANVSGTVVLAADTLVSLPGGAFAGLSTSGLNLSACGNLTTLAAGVFEALDIAPAGFVQLPLSVTFLPRGAVEGASTLAGARLIAPGMSSASCTSPGRTTVQWRGATVCTSCAPGSYCVDGVAAPCPAGTWNSQAGASNADECAACPAGTWSSQAGASTATECVACPAGTWSSQAEASNAAVCVACPAGTWSSQAGASSATVCAACPDGTGSSAEGASSQSVCKACDVSQDQATGGWKHCHVVGSDPGDSGIPPSLVVVLAALVVVAGAVAGAVAYRRGACNSLVSRGADGGSSTGFAALVEADGGAGGAVQLSDLSSRSRPDPGSHA